MDEVTKRQFDYLMLNGKNYQTWVVDCRFHLAAMQLTHTITPRAEGAPAIPKHEIAKALEDRFSKQKTVILPQARRDWTQLRFLDYKTLEAYNSALHRIVGQLRFCGQKITDAEMIEKTLETFHPANMVLQQHNELLMKIFNMRPVGANALPEAHASFHKKSKTFFKKGNPNSKKQGQNDWKFKKQPNKGQKPNSQGEGKAQKGDAGGTEPHLVQMYQEWKKRENPEAHFIQARVDAVTGEHTVVLPQPVEKPEGGNAMDVDPTTT
ncbi:uncharacterized protein [Miscanthus floridulus]|uniref:uncharacterized protein n=1 Tax=Miscanthus floridulus TaxID=154761 RepID=UPI0034575DB3